MIRRLAALLACLLALAAPARAESAALARDYDALCAVLSEEYPFFPVLARRGIDAGALLDLTGIYTSCFALLFVVVAVSLAGSIPASRTLQRLRPAEVLHGR